jgi:hypothetical protein
VDELALADVDAHVREGALEGVEEHQVARFQLVALHLQQARRMRLLVGAARQHQAQAAVEHVAREAAAVEAGFLGVAAAAVGHAEEVHRGHHQVGRAVAHLLHQRGVLDRARVDQPAFAEEPRDRIGRRRIAVGRGARQRGAEQRRADGEGAAGVAQGAGKGKHGAQDNKRTLRVNAQ